LLERLADEFRENRRILEEVVSANRRFNAAALELGTMDAVALRSISDDSLRAFFDPIGGWHIFYPVRAESLSMHQSGEFRLIQSRGIRAALNGCNEAVDLAEVQGTLVTAKDNERIEIYSAAGFYEAVIRDRDVGPNEMSAKRGVHLEMLREGRIQQNLISHGGFRGYYIELLRDAMTALEDLLILLETEAAR
jgi:hypothetical protein